MPSLSWRLCLVTDNALCETHGLGLEEVVAQALAGGADCIQLREKNIDDDALATRAHALLRLLARHASNVPLIINDRVGVAVRVQAHGVHLGQTDMPVQEARRLMPNGIIGLSVENVEQLKQAENLQVDYLALSPLFATNTKTDIAPPWGLKGLSQARQCSKFPLVVIGGLTSNNVASAIAGGADAVAVVSAICADPQPEAAARRILSAMNAQPST